MQTHDHLHLKLKFESSTSGAPLIIVSNVSITVLRYFDYTRLIEIYRFNLSTPFGLGIARLSGSYILRPSLHLTIIYTGY